MLPAILSKLVTVIRRKKDRVSELSSHQRNRVSIMIVAVSQYQRPKERKAVMHTVTQTMHPQKIHVKNKEERYNN